MGKYDRGQLVELASGIDALYLSGRGQIAAGLISDLDAARRKAENDTAAVAIDLGADVDTFVEPRSFGRYRYRVSCEHGLIGVSDAPAMPPLRLQPTARFLHAVGPAAAVAWFSELACGFTGDLRLSASRVDVFADWQGWEFLASTRHSFVGRATKRNTSRNQSR